MILGSFRDPDLLRSALEFALKPSVDAEGAVLIITSAFGDPETAAVVYSFLKGHYEAVVAKLPTDFGAALPLVGATFCDESHRDDLREFLGPRSGGLVGGRRSLARVIEKIDSCIAERRTQERSLSSFFGSSPGSPEARPN
jgi:alanyl aminopeptidase